MTAKQDKARARLKSASAKARKKGLKPFTKAFGAFVKKELQKK